MANFFRQINSLKKTRSGFTLIEILIVISIIVLLLLISLWAYQTQLSKGRDSRRKADLNMLEKVFEDYYNDHNCYPKEVDQLVPNYLSEFPKDPVTSNYYEWSVEDCNAYRIYAKLDWEQDPMIAAAGCSSGCGPGGENPGGSCDYNYGVCSQNTSLETCGGGECPNACQGEVCNVLNKSEWSCPRWFCDPDCEGKCKNPAYQCTKK